MVLVLSQSQNSSGNWQVVVKLKCMLDTLYVYYVWLCPLFWVCSQGRGCHLIVNTINNGITIASIVNRTFLFIETKHMLLVDPAHLSASLGKNVLECDRGTNAMSWGVEHKRQHYCTTKSSDSNYCYEVGLNIYTL